ncbi:PTS fructose transporter subunit IIABC [Agrococcus carbonis]|uniref:PTS system D-fructose-specific IIA component (F1P-forming), Frc family /PTS system D-fructose-specific IIB component (F1P-forming), Frc family /PTS system D-fructose-specific IIC component (F1P-for... n=1 Tax=Agrococcus carbonis TaxID=684552 RepID=A0A1H1L0Z5_9MICO|nr:fructose-specific PTS transporter subunit EIIC [Agrococcus carbonis]SDR67950.1 PTS system D-fructose-specific IIA component (F1P-forming), Frc family /PTS system D-fructose-specific IIB component (F1P-forming), Frc family /PTS system D-fructose-specific IIC component (F1P-forming), Frc family [Agrococcus carbonis]
MPQILTSDLVLLDADLGPVKESVIRALAARAADTPRVADADGLADAVLAREALTPTGMGAGIAIPHCKSSAVLEPTLGFARLRPAVDFGAGDGPADLVFMIMAPEGAAETHLAVLSRLAGSLIDEEFTSALRAAASPQEVVALVERAVADEEEPEEPAAAAEGRRGIVAITACPTGIAHTYMAADALKAAAERAGVRIAVETQGSSGTKRLEPATIADADAVVFAVDVDVRDRSRFAGKPFVQVPVKRGIDAPDELIAEALRIADDPAGARVAGGSGADEAQPQASSRSIGGTVKRSLLTGVSYMIPFVAGGGLLLALGFLLGGFEIAFAAEGTSLSTAQDVALSTTLWNLPPEGLLYYLGCVAFAIGQASMGFLVPALAGYIAFGIADRPGIAPGFVAGSVAGLMGAGFLGGIVGGLLAGVAAWWIGSWRVPVWMRGLMPVVVIPLLASIFASGLMVMLLGGPIAALSEALYGFLGGLTGTGAILLGLLLGTMMAFDLGGPINKVAYGFAVAGLAEGSPENPAPWMIMAAVMAAGMVPPLGMALATVIDRRLFSLAERENGKAAWLLGASFISEGAIPFAAADPLRVIPASILGAATTGAISMAAGVTSQAPHGGIFVFFAIGNLLMFVVAIVVGAIITALAVVALKRWARRAPQPVAEESQPVAVAA